MGTTATEIQRLQRWERYIDESTNPVAPYVRDALSWTGTDTDLLSDAGHEYADQVAMFPWRWADDLTPSRLFDIIYDACQEYGYAPDDNDPNWLVTLACYYWHRREWDAFTDGLDKLSA